MSNPPPPIGPPPEGPPLAGPPEGWYPDPDGKGQGFRWWNGETWTTQFSQDPKPWGHGLTPAGEWTNAMLRTVSRRFGHFFPMIVLLIVPFTLLATVSGWFAVRDLVFTIDTETGQMEVTGNGGGAGWYIATAVGFVALFVANVALLLAAARQTQAEIDERTEIWSVSMREMLPRMGRALGLSLVLLAMVFGLYLVLAIGAVAAPVALLLILPAWIVAVVWLGARFSLVGIAAALAPNSPGRLRLSWDLTRTRSRAIAGRMALTFLFGISVSLLMRFVATPFIALAGGTGATPVEPGSNTYVMADFLGDNPATFAIGQLFSAVGAGLAMVIWAVGFVLIYQDLSGPVEAGEADHE